MTDLSFLTAIDKKLPEVRPLSTVRIHQKIREGGKERIQKFEGIIIAVQGSNADPRIIVRKLSSGVGVERIFPLHSPNIARIELIKTAKSRRAKHYYLRKLRGRAARQKGEIWIKQEVEKKVEAKTEEKPKDGVVEVKNKVESKKEPVGKEVNIKKTEEEK